MTSTVVRLDVRPLTRAIGAEIHGFDPRAADLDGAVAEIRRALLRHQVVLLPALHLDIAGQIELTRRFGRINPAHPVPGTALPGEPEIFVSTSYRLEWHADHTYMPEPSAISSLQSIASPAAGGDTMWASGIAAYASLSEPLQDLAQRLTTVHTPSPSLVQLLARSAPGTWNGRPVTSLEPTAHPLVVRHESGRPSLFVHPRSSAMPGSTAIPGLGEHESDRLLELFVEHYTRPEHCVRYRWTAGTLALWDNRVTLHRPVVDHDAGDPREFHRVSIQGGRPVAWRTSAIEEVAAR